MTLKRTLTGASAALMLAAPAFAGTSYPGYVPDLEPANPTVGECYARVKIPAQYQTGTQTVLKREAHTRLKVQQAEFATRHADVMVKEPSVRYEVRQPRYASVTEQIVTRPAYDKLSVSEPRFQTVTETIQTSAPRLVWKLGNPGQLARQGYVIHSTADAGYQGQGYSSTTQFGAQGGERCGSMCEIWCLVEEPGDSVTVSRQVMSSPGEVHRTRIPHQTQTITKQVLADPGGVTEIPVPAEYRSVALQDIVRPAGEALIEVPAEYGEVQTKTLVAEERYEWRRVLCAPGTSVPRVGHGSGITHSSGGAYTSSHGHGAGTAQSSTTHTTTYSGTTATRQGYYGVDDWDGEFDPSGTGEFPSPTHSAPAYGDRHAPLRARR
ncbi:MAG: hypothetical protein WBF53_10195 [Litorimonas sp.]